MKKITLSLLALLIALTSFAQKPKKTHDASKFMKKVQFSFTPDLIHKWMPNDNALAYVSEKTGKSLDELSTSNKANLEIIKTSISEINAMGLIYSWDKIEVVVKQETPVKIADLLIHCHSKKQNFAINLTNCVQTNLSWYLGDGIIPEGEGFEKASIASAEKKSKKIGGLLGKMNDMNNGMKKMEDDAVKELAAAQRITDSLNAIRPGYEAKYTSYKFESDKLNHVMFGYYLTNDGIAHETFLPYQKPEDLLGTKAQSHLYVYKNLVNHPVDLNNTANDSYFKEKIYKKDIKAFYLNGEMYSKIHTGIFGWVIVVNEGAIHSFITVDKSSFNGKDKYSYSIVTQKLNGENGAFFNKIMANNIEEKLLSMMSDAPQIIQQYKDGELTLEQAEVEYNIWFDKEYPGKVDYLNKG